MNGRRSFLVPALLSVTLVGACTDAPVAIEDRSVTAVPSRALEESDAPRGVDEHFVSIARRIPGYGGHSFRLDGSLIVFLTDVEKRDLALGVLQEELEQYRLVHGRDVSPVEIVRADYEFLQLTRWRAGAVRHAVMNLPGVTSIRTSKERNRIEVGVENAATERLARQALEAKGVPLGAVRFPIVGRVIPDVAASFLVPDSLWKFASVLQGGRTVFSDGTVSGSGSSCTIGAIGRGKVGTALEGRTFFLTASHCTPTFVATEGISFYQPISISPFVGAEAFDGRRFFPGDSEFPVTCGHSQGCRLTDAALIEVTGRAAAVGEIARPTALGGSLEISATKPYFKITALSPGFTPLGPLQMVGRTSGWQSGYMLDGDWDVDVPFEDGAGGTIWLLGLGIATYYSQGGDSGAPVFQGAGSTSHIRGIHSGTFSYEGTLYRLFSTLQAIHDDQLYSHGLLILDDIEWRWGY